MYSPPAGVPAVFLARVVGPAKDVRSCTLHVAALVTAAAEAAIASKLHTDVSNVGRLSFVDLQYCVEADRVYAPSGCRIDTSYQEVLPLLVNQPLLLESCMPLDPELFNIATSQPVLCQRARRCDSTSALAARGKFGYVRLSGVNAVQRHISEYGAALARFTVNEDLYRMPLFGYNVKNADRVVYRRKSSGALGAPLSRGTPGRGVMFNSPVLLVGYSNPERYWVIQ
jgi:hypothetical protein